MAKRQSNESPSNVVRIDGEGKVHANGGKITPLCKFRGHGDHTWITTDEAVTCGRCVNLQAKRDEARARLEYATRAAETQDEVLSQAPAILPAVEPVKVCHACNADLGDCTCGKGETVTVPVDYDNPSAGRRELDASKGERVLSEDTYRVKVSPEFERQRESDRADYVKRMEALRQSGNMTPESIHALIRELQGMVSETPASEGFSVTFHEPKNGPALDCEIPPLPEGVSPNVWELAHTANTESARAYWTRKAEAERTAFLDAQEAMEESRKAVELETPPF